MDQTQRRLAANILPSLGPLQIAAIKTPDMIAMVRAIEARGARDVAKRALETTGQIFRYTIAHGYAKRNPATDIQPGDILKASTKSNYARIDAKELPNLLRQIEVYQGTHITRLAIKLMALTFVRTSELIGAKWSEFDLEAARWDIPAERIKMRTPHIVPLATQALEVLNLRHPLSGHTEWLFPGDRNAAKPISNNTILQALKRMGYQGRMTGHGFRRLASTILHEQGYTHDHIELQLAHAPRNAVSAAYNHALYLAPPRQDDAALGRFIRNHAARSQLSIDTTHSARRRRWLGLPVIPPIEGGLADVLQQLPHFGRQPFTMVSVNGSEIAVNPYLDMLYRAPTRQGESPVPVGVVSKNYRLVDHHQVLMTIEDVIADFGISSSELQVRGEWTLHGERARFSLMFPDDDRFSMKLDDKDDMRFRIEVYNSVEGSCRLMVIAGWLRFVCSNGLILGTALIQLRQQHQQQLQMEGMGRVLREALQSARDDRDTVANWRSRRIDADALTEWVDKDVHERWGIKAAIRVLAILRTGRDAEPNGDLKNKRRPSEVAIISASTVTG